MPRKPYTERTGWTPQQIAIVERYMDDANRRKTFARWDLYEEEIGHPVSSIRSMAHFIRCRRRDSAARDVRHTLRALADALAGPLPEKPASAVKLPAPKPVPTRAPGDLVDTMRCTSTAQLMLHSEIRSRTGNWFGDPAPGRSALDKKRAGASP